MKQSTEKISKHIGKVKDFYHAHKRLPSYREICDLCVFKSKRSAYLLINKMEEFGLIIRENGKIIPTNTLGELPILGRVEAGFPTPASEELLDTMTIDDYLVPNKSATYILEVSGESMIDAGILPHDLVLVERGKPAKNGDIVIAEVDGKWTMKYFFNKNGRISLEPANKKFKTIYPTEELKISAVVISTMRRY